LRAFREELRARFSLSIERDDVMPRSSFDFLTILTFSEVGRSDRKLCHFAFVFCFFDFRIFTEAA
jgi:hypothetical protein